MLLKWYERADIIEQENIYKSVINGSHFNNKLNVLHFFLENAKSEKLRKEIRGTLEVASGLDQSMDHDLGIT